MAGTSLLALIDDIASILDDVAVLSQVAAKKTAGVLGDDLALNAQQVAGVAADRELPVVWAVAVGSFKNKLILVPAALGISAFIPWAVTPLLMLGGAFLCYEGFEKLAHKLMHSQEQERAHHDKLIEALAEPSVDLVAYEQKKIKGAIRTDFILSAEIITITLGTVATAAFSKQVMVLSVVAICMTVLVYGLVGCIVKLDDGGLYLSRKTSLDLLGKFQRWLGKAILMAAPYMMKSLSIAGTVAMFMVGGGILSHGISELHDLIHHLSQGISVSLNLSMLEWVVPSLLDTLVGLIAGAITLAGTALFGQMLKRFKTQPKSH